MKKKHHCTISSSSKFHFSFSPTFTIFFEGTFLSIRGEKLILGEVSSTWELYNSLFLIFDGIFLICVSDKNIGKKIFFFFLITVLIFD